MWSHCDVQILKPLLQYHKIEPKRTLLTVSYVLSPSKLVACDEAIVWYIVDVCYDWCTNHKMRENLAIEEIVWEWGKRDILIHSTDVLFLFNPAVKDAGRSELKAI